jgi:hypothetical protein
MGCCERRPSNLCVVDCNGNRGGGMYYVIIRARVVMSWNWNIMMVMVKNGELLGNGNGWNWK